MKKNLQTMMLMLVAVFAFQVANAQLPAGSVAPDFTATDIDGVEHTMSDYLADGYSIIVDFSATWCGPCWSYHTAGNLEEVWANHGPAGMEGVNEDTTDDVMILFIEGDDDTTAEDLVGTGSNTTGDWTEGTYYPIIDDAENLFNLYACTYYPTMYTICQSGLVTETGQISADAHYDFASAYDCGAATMATDVNMISYDGELVTCSDLDVIVTFQNFGTENLTTAEFTVTGGDAPLTATWDGDLATFESTQFNIGTISLSSASAISIEVTSMDDYDENDEAGATIGLATEASTQWFLDIAFDCWPEEMGWNVKDESGTTVAEAAAGTYAGLENASETWNVGSVGCYTFTATDAYGDGMYGSQWTGCEIDGSWSLSSSGMGNIAAYDGTYNYEEALAGASATTVSVNELAGVNVVWNVFPNPTDGQTNISYSIDNASEVTVDVLNILGERVMSMDLGTQGAGQYLETLDLNSFESGVYLINLNANGNVSTQRVTLN